MNFRKLPSLLHTARGRGSILGLLITASLLALTHALAADAPKTVEEYRADPALMLDAYRHVEAASVSDAIEQLLHQRRYMSHHMQSIFPTKFAGRALTVRLVKQSKTPTPPHSPACSAPSTPAPPAPSTS